MVREEVERRDNSFVFVVTTVSEFPECRDERDCPDRFEREGHFFCSGRGFMSQCRFEETEEEA